MRLNKVFLPTKKRCKQKPKTKNTCSCCAHPLVRSTPYLSRRLPFWHYLRFADRHYCPTSDFNKKTLKKKRTHDPKSRSAEEWERWHIVYWEKKVQSHSTATEEKKRRKTKHNHLLERGDVRGVRSGFIHRVSFIVRHTRTLSLILNTTTSFSLCSSKSCFSSSSSFPFHMVLSFLQMSRKQKEKQNKHKQKKRKIPFRTHTPSFYSRAATNRGRGKKSKFKECPRPSAWPPNYADDAHTLTL